MLFKNLKIKLCNLGEDSKKKTKTKRPALNKLEISHCWYSKISTCLKHLEVFLGPTEQ